MDGENQDRFPNSADRGGIRGVLARARAGIESGIGGGEDGEIEGSIFDDSGTIDPVAISRERSKRRGRTWTDEQKRDASERAKRRRSGEPTAKEKLAVDPEPASIPVKAVEQLASGLGAVHTVLAMALAAPELALSEEESKALAESAANVAKYYGPISLGGKRGAWIGFGGVLGMVYLPRLFAYARRTKTEQAPSAPSATNQ